MNIINQLISAILQTILFTLIPFIWWLIFHRKKENFFSWIGIKKVTIKNRLVLFMVITLVVSFLIGIIILQLVDKELTANSQFQSLTFMTILQILIHSLIQTGLSEEILFRGFLCKRLINKFGFMVGNLIQSLLFGIMHGLFFVASIGWAKALIIILITGFLGWLMGYTNEKKAEGSILPSWLLHSLSNVISAFISL